MSVKTHAVILICSYKQYISSWQQHLNWSNV